MQAFDLEQTMFGQGGDYLDFMPDAGAVSDGEHHPCSSQSLVGVRGGEKH